MSNDEKLIELVRGYPALYDLCNLKYMDSDFKNNIWSKIGADMKTDGSLCKSRWANIRDNFRKSVNKQKTRSGHRAGKVKPYKYSEQLNFLKQFFEERATRINIDPEVTNTSDNESEEVVSPKNEENTRDCSTAEVIDPVTIQSKCQNSSRPKPTGTIPRKIRKLSVPNHTPPKTAASTVMEYIVEKNKNMNCPPPPQHPVDAFLAGLAPVLKKLSLRDWHYAKGEIFATAQKYEFNMLNRQQHFVDPLDATSSNEMGPIAQLSPAGSYLSSWDGQQSSSSTVQNEETAASDLTLGEYPLSVIIKEKKK